jgi:hypothetical protein
MDRHELLYRLYENHDTETLRSYQALVDLFPPVDSRVALDYWQTANEELEEQKTRSGRRFPMSGRRSRRWPHSPRAVRRFPRWTCTRSTTVV